jgi:hypothetical protein
MVVGTHRNFESSRNLQRSPLKFLAEYSLILNVK